MATPYAPPAYAFGGPVRVIETICAALLAAGHEVTVVTTDALDERRRVPAGTPGVPAGVEVVRLPNLHHGLAANAMGWWPRGYRGWLRENAARFDAVHLHDLYSAVSVGAARTGRPYLLQPHGSTAPSRDRGRPLVKRAFLWAWGRRTLREAGALLAATEAEERELVAAGAPRERIHRIPPPLDLPQVAERAPLPERPTAVFLGRFDPIKRIDLLLEAAARAGVRVRLVGSGAEEPALRRRAEALGVEVEWPGFLEGEAKVRALQSAHVKVLLSRSEGLPVAALEAMACGTPVVLSEGCNLPEVDGRAGAVVAGEADAAAAAIRRVLGERERLGAGAQAFAAGFRAEVVLPALLELYATISTQSSDRPQSSRH